MSARSTAPRVAITGVGVIAPGGTGTEAYWQSLLSGVSSIRELTRFDASRYPCRLAGQIDDDFDTAGLVPARLLPQTDISTRYALVAGHHALSDAGVASGPEAAPDYAMGVVTSTAQGGFDFTHREFRKLWHQGPEYVSVYESFAWFYAVNTGQLSIRHTLRGPSAALVAEQAGGLDAIGHARRTVRRGTPLMLTGGIDSAFDPWGWSSQLAGGLVSTVDDPERAYLPFDDDASGYVPGEGGAMFVLEDLDAALRRGAERIWGRWPDMRPPSIRRPERDGRRVWPALPNSPWPTPVWRPTTSRWCSPTAQAYPAWTGPRRQPSPHSSGPAVCL